jgi:hypothetical protein
MFSSSGPLSSLLWGLSCRFWDFEMGRLPILPQNVLSSLVASINSDWVTRDGPGPTHTQSALTPGRA